MEKTFIRHKKVIRIFSTGIQQGQKGNCSGGGNNFFFFRKTNCLFHAKLFRIKTCLKKCLIYQIMHYNYIISERISHGWELIWTKFDESLKKLFKIFFIFVLQLTTWSLADMYRVSEAGIFPSSSSNSYKAV